MTRPIGGARQPYPVASDYDDATPVDAAPFELSSPALGERIAVLQQWVEATHTECVGTRREIGELRDYVMRDHAPRITAVEQKAGLNVPHGLVVAGKYGGAIGATLAFVEVVIPLIKQFVAQAQR